MTMRETMLDIGRKAIQHRASLDGDTDYDPEVDEEGYVISILIAMRHWCSEYGFDWNEQVEKAEMWFEEDLAEELVDHV